MPLLIPVGLLAASLVSAGLALAIPVTPAFAGREGRIVVIEASGPDDPHVKAQTEALLAEAAGLRERDMSLFARFPTGAPVRLFGDAPSAPPASRSKSSPQAPFVVLLFGKDGGEKLRSTEVVSAGAFFGLIDEMPMRRQEMRR